MEATLAGTLIAIILMLVKLIVQLKEKDGLRQKEN